jgi:lysylphosphatidylglycerol synthetase-like protein (DUF2156 family)
MASDRQKARELVERWGWNATSFQTLSPEFSYWFSGDACVAYVDLDNAWVGAGAPICADSELDRVAREFVRAAQARGKRPSFFAVEQRFLAATGLPSLALGEQPVYDPQAWAAQLAASRSLREQLRRARAKGVEVQQACGERDARELGVLYASWLRARPLETMGFLTGLDPFSAAADRRYLVARRGPDALGFAVLSPVYARRGWLIEHLVRASHAPNGTSELLVDTAMRELASVGVRWATLGLSPLAGDVDWPLRLVRRWARPLFNFEGLRAFKAKLGPREWDAVHLAYPHGRSALGALHDGLSAFARGRPLRFARRSLLRQFVPTELRAADA